MFVQAKKNMALSALALAMVVISLPVFSVAATSPTVSVLSPLAQGLRAPVKMALDAEGNTYVADKRIGGIVKFNAYGVLQTIFRTTNIPNGIAFAQDGTMLVSQASSVIRYNAATGQETGRLIGGQLQLPAGIAVDDVTGYIYVADSRANQIEVYTASGDYVKAFAQGVTADASGNTVSNPVGKLSGPTGVSFEKVSRQIAVADTVSQRVQFFDVDGNFVKSIGNPISTTIGATVGMMQFDAPAAIAFEYSKGQVPVVLNRMYVVDSFQANIQVIDPATSTALLVAGTTKNYIGSVGTANGQLMTPSDAVFDSINSRLMTVNGNGNVAIYGIDGGTNPTDTTAPSLTIDPVPATVSVPSITISGTVEAGAKVVVTAGTAVTAGAVVYTSATTWKSDITELVAGNNTITVTATDAAGNTTPAQTVSVAYLLQATVVTVSPSVPTLTNMPNLVMTGTVDDGATVMVTNGTTTISGAATVVGANWSYTVSLAEGANSITITAQKPMSLSTTKVLDITLDSISPAMTVSALSDGSYTSNQVMNITGTVSDTSAVTVLVNNAPAPLVNGAFSVPISLVTGANTITVIASDLVGNTTVDNRRVYFDTTKPVISVVSPMDNSFTNTAIVQIIGSVDKVATITVAGVSAVVDNNNNWLATVELIAGLNTIEVVATDLYGNSSTLKRSINLDTVKPTLAISSPVQDVASKQSSIVIAGVVDDNYTASLTYSVNGTLTTVPVTAGSFAFTVAFVNEGVYPVVITATDYAGNSTTATRNVIYDVTPPLLTLDAVKWQAQAQGGKVSGTVEPGAVVTVNEGGTAIGTVTIDGDRWSADLKGISYNQNKLTVVATDAAGNSTTKILKANGN